MHKTKNYNPEYVSVNKQFTEIEIANKHKKFNLTSNQENTNLYSNEDCEYNWQKLKNLMTPTDDEDVEQ